MYESKLHMALLAKVKTIEASDRSNANAIFDALVNLQLITRSAVEDQLISTSFQPEWRAAA